MTALVASLRKKIPASDERSRQEDHPGEIETNPKPTHQGGLIGTQGQDHAEEPKRRGDVGALGGCRLPRGGITRLRRVQLPHSLEYPPHLGHTVNLKDPMIVRTSFISSS